MSGRLRVGHVQPNVVVSKVIITERCEGEGTEEEPIRIVRYIHTLEGRLLGKIDELEDEAVIKNQAPWRIR